MGISITILGSGSSGNCAFIETEQTAVLVDAGLSHRQITQRLASINRDLADIDAILLTHNHNDHTSALPVICKNLSLPVYANRLTAEAVTEESAFNDKVRVSWRLFTNGSSFAIGDLSVEPFSIPHDAFDPVGFTLRTTTHSVGFVTDLGHATKLVMERLRGVDALVLESNHDVQLLQDDPVRSWAIKQRIMSRQGHLSNDAAATVVGEIVSDRLQHVILAHLSRDCNRPELAKSATEQKLKQLGVTHVRTIVADQAHPSPTVTLESVNRAHNTPQNGQDSI